MSGPHTAFFYGTLMAPEVFYAVVYGRSRPPNVIRQLHSFQPAVLHGYCRHRIQNTDYPGVIAEEGQSVHGVYATGLTDANIDKLDRFEGTQYRKELAKVWLMSRGVKCKGGGEGEGGSGGDAVSSPSPLVEGEEKQAIVYVYKDKGGLEPGEWDFEHFRVEKMESWTRDEFINEECIGFLDEDISEADLKQGQHVKDAVMGSAVGSCHDPGDATGTSEGCAQGGRPGL